MEQGRALADLPAHDRAGAEMYALAERIFPICRSITGNGVRQTLRELGQHIPIEVHEIPTGTPVLDWTIPREWNIREAYIKDEQGRVIVDMAWSNLHVMSYSVPVRTRMPLDELKRHIFTLPDQPDFIPYRTSYYAENWAFCMEHRRLEAMADGIYEVVIDATLDDGSLTYGEYLHRGDSEQEVLLSAHVCHPSLANDNCSGLVLLALLAKWLKDVRTRFSYRFIFAPGTIGAIAWLARNEAMLDRIRHGLIVSMVGDAGGPRYKKSRQGDAFIDRAFAHVLQQAAPAAVVEAFSPYGYDERQYCSPGFNLPVGLFQRSKFGSIPQYHTSADNMDFISAENLGLSYRLIVDALNIIENDRVVLNLMPKGEPQLGRRGLYSAIGGDKDAAAANMAMLWVLNQADGKTSLLDIAERAGMPFSTIDKAARLLQNHELLSILQEK